MTVDSGRDRRSTIELAAAAIGFGVVAWFLRRDAVDYDGMALLEHVENGRLRDPAHPLYLAVLRAWASLLGLFGPDTETAARSFSCVGGALLFFALGSRVAARGLDRTLVFVIALTTVGSSAVWREIAGIEVYAPMLAAIVFGRSAVERFRRTGRLRDGVLAASTIVFAIGMHVASVIALPWQLAGKRNERRIDLRAVAIGVGATSVLLAFGLLIDAPSGRSLIAELQVLARGFIALRWSDGFPAAPLRHLVMCGQFLAETAPGVLALIMVAGWAARGRRPAVGHALLLSTPFLLIFIATGVPILALLLPVVLGGCELASSLFTAAQPLHPWIRRGAIIVCCASIGWSAYERFDDHITIDPWTRDARALAAALPSDGIVISGELTFHLRRRGGVEARSLNEAIFALQNEGKQKRDFLELLERWIDEITRQGRRPFLDYTGYRALAVVGVGEEPLSPFVDRDRIVPLRSDPPLFLAPLIPR